MSGLSDSEITAIRSGNFQAFQASEIALLHMADALADTPANVSDELYAELPCHFSEEQLIELAASARRKTFAPAITPCSMWAAIVSQGAAVKQR